MKSVRYLVWDQPQTKVYDLINRFKCRGKVQESLPENIRISIALEVRLPIMAQMREDFFDRRGQKIKGIPNERNTH